MLGALRECIILCLIVTLKTFLLCRGSNKLAKVFFLALNKATCPWSVRVSWTIIKGKKLHINAVVKLLKKSVPLSVKTIFSGSKNVIHCFSSFSIIRRNWFGNEKVLKYIANDKNVGFFLMQGG